MRDAQSRKLLAVANFRLVLQVVDIIQSSWNMTADGQGVFMESQGPRRRPATSRRAPLSPQLSIDPRPIRPKLTNPRLTCDSVSSMLAANPVVSQAALLAHAGSAEAPSQHIPDSKIIDLTHSFAEAKRGG